MSSTIHRNFKQTSDADNARNALIAAGFPAAAVTLNQHKALPGDAATNLVDNVLQGLTSGKTTGTATPSHPAALLSVDIDDDEQGAKAATIMQGHGATEA